MNIPSDFNNEQDSGDAALNSIPDMPPEKEEAEDSVPEEAVKKPAKRRNSRRKRPEANDGPEQEATSSQGDKSGTVKAGEAAGKPRKITKTARKARLKKAPEKSGAPEAKDALPAEMADDLSGSEAGREGRQAEGEGALFKKSHRGKRGGRKRNHKAEPEQIQPAAAPASLAAPRHISVEELCKIPALPPGLEIVEELAAICESQEKTDSQKSRRPASRKSPKNAVPKRRMFISVIPGEQVEVGLAEDGALVEYYLDMLRHSKLKGNIYKGVIHNIDPNLQAAFVDFGVGKNGFLQIDEVHPEYWHGYAAENGEKKKLPPIQKVLRPGQEVLVQVVKEASGNKGAFLTTWLSLAGRFLVLTPGQEQVGVSRKVTDPEERQRLKEMMNGLSPGAGLGVIVRTVGEGANKTTLKTDLQYLKRLWREIRKKVGESPAPALIHQEPGLSERAVRDYLTEDVSEIWVDNEEEANNVRAMAGLLFPRKKNLVHIYEDASHSLWDHFNLRKQLEQIYARDVSLPSGGRLVFDQTEALMAIDINSGRISGKGNFEAMAFKTNMEASEVIARQLRLRDVGGQVVIDFIEMREKKHVQEVEKALRQAMKNDRARHDVAHISTFGLLELVRQRMGSSALSLSMEPCAACGGTGQRRNMEWQALQCIRDLGQKLKNANGDKYVCEYPRELGLYLLNYKREALRKLESDFGKSLEIRIKI